MAGALALSRDNEAGTTMNPRTFLTGMYQSGVNGQFDALSFHPYTGSSGPAHRRLLQPDHRRRPRPRRHHAIARRRRKKIWGTEFAYSTSNTDKGVSRAEAARLLRLYIDLWRQQAYAGPLFHFTYRDMGTDRSSRSDNFGLVRRDFSPKQGLGTFRSVVGG